MDVFVAFLIISVKDANAGCSTDLGTVLGLWLQVLHLSDLFEEIRLLHPWFGSSPLEQGTWVWQDHLQVHCKACQWWKSFASKNKYFFLIWMYLFYLITFSSLLLLLSQLMIVISGEFGKKCVPKSRDCRLQITHFQGLSNCHWDEWKC